MELESKICTKCDKLKPLTEYHWVNSNHTKRKAGCTVCEAAYAKSYQRTVAARKKAAILAAKVRKSKSAAFEVDTLDMNVLIQGLTQAIGTKEIVKNTGLTYEDLTAIQSGVFLKIQRLLSLHETYCHNDHIPQILLSKVPLWE